MSEYGTDLAEALDILRNWKGTMPSALADRVKVLLAKYPEVPALKPCPWELPGDMKQRRRVNRIEGGDYFVECNCGARGPESETEADAIAAWNRRVTP